MPEEMNDSSTACARVTGVRWIWCENLVMQFVFVANLMT